jgi:glucokinase
MLRAALELAASLMDAESAVHVVGIGVCTAGWVDDAGVVRQTVSRVHGWEGMPLAASFTEALHLPCCALNDAHAAALGELRFGGGRGSPDFLLVTLGTGIGGAVVSDGRLMAGTTGVAGAIGHLTLVPDGKPCRCGARGCLERYVSGEALADSALSSGYPAATDARVLAALANDGDEVAQRLWKEAGRLLGHGLVSALHLLNPARILVAGGLAAAGELLLGPAQQVIDEEALPRARVRLALARLGVDAGLIGAGSDAWRRFGAVWRGDLR